jgi:hypothetical protein
MLREASECAILVKPNDMGNVIDYQPEKLMSTSLKNLKGTKIEESKTTGAFQFFADIIGRMVRTMGNPEYADVTPSNPLQQKSKKGLKSDIVIPLRGVNSKYCLFRKDNHISNNVFYKLQSNGILTFRCTDDKCDQHLNPKFTAKNTIKVIKMMLTNEEKARCKKILGFGGTTPISAKEIVQRKKWEPEKITKTQTITHYDDILKLAANLKNEDDDELEDIMSLVNGPKKRTIGV